MRKWIWVIACVLPTVSGADELTEIRAMIDRIESAVEAGEALPVDYLPGFEDETIQIPLLDDTPASVADQQNLEYIRNEELSLKKYRTELSELQRAMTNRRVSVGQTSENIQLIDEQMLVLARQIHQLEQSVGHWQSKLEDLTYERQIARSLIRATASDRERWWREYFTSPRRLSGDPMTVLALWLFGEQSIGEILEQERLQTLQMQAIESRMGALGNAKQKIEEAEIRTARIRQQIQNRADNLASERLKLYGLAEAKSELRRRQKNEVMTLQQQVSAKQQERDQVLARLTRLYQERESGFEIEAKPEFSQFNIPDPVVLAQDTTANPTPTPNTDPVPAAIADPPAARIPNFIYPVDRPVTITATYLDPEYFEILGTDHHGVDMYVPQGSPVYTAADGMVVEALDAGLGYSYIIVDHGQGFWTVYGHMSQIQVAVGDIVARGQSIGKSGGTPGSPGAGTLTTGPHLHWEMFRDGEHVDPLEYVAE